MIPGETLFVDTNILIYSTNNLSVWHLPAERMLDSARLQGISLIISPQIIREYISVFSRGIRVIPKIKTDGLLKNLDLLRTSFILVDENREVIFHLIELLREIPIIGKQIHDANIVATMMAHGVSRLLTHNTKDFERYAGLITVVPLLEGE